MATRTVGSRGRGRAEAPAPRSVGERLLAEVWHTFADPARLGWSLLFTGVGFLAVGVLSRPEVRAAFEAASHDDPLVHRLYGFLGLDAPLASWWLVLLVSVSALLLVATVIERGGDLALLLHRGRRTEPKAVPGSPIAAARRAAEALGRSITVGVGEETLVLTRTSRLFKVGVGVLCVAALVFVGAMVWERDDGVAGEVLIVPGETTDRVQLPGPMGTTVDKPLGFALSPIEFGHGGPAVKLEVLGGGHQGQNLTITPEQSATVGGTRLTARATRPVAGGERFQLTVVDKKTGKTRAVTAGVSDAFPADAAAPKGAPQLEVMGWSKDFRGLGPAVRIQSVTPAGQRDAFWVFQNDPDFDLHDRAKRFGLRLDSVSQQRDVILGVTRHPGEPVGYGAAGLLLVGLGLCLAGLGDTQVVRLARGEVVGAPAADQAVKAAVKAAARGPKA